MLSMSLRRDVDIAELEARLDVVEDLAVRPY